MKKSLPRLGLAALLVAALLLAPAGAGIAAAAGEPPAADAPGVASQPGIEWIAGLLGHLFDSWLGGTDKESPGQPAPRDKDGVNGTVGSGIDPSGITGSERPHDPPPRTGH